MSLSMVATSLPCIATVWAMRERHPAGPTDPLSLTVPQRNFLLTGYGLCFLQYFGMSIDAVMEIVKDVTDAAEARRLLARTGNSW